MRSATECRGAHRPHRRSRVGECRDLTVEADQTHHHGSEAVRLAQRDMQFQGGGRRLRSEHPCPAAQYARTLGAATGQHAGVVGQEHNGQMERVCHHDEVCGLVGGVRVDRARQHPRLVGHNRDRMAAQMRQRADDRHTELWLHLEPFGAVEDHIEHRAHVIDAAVVAGDDVEQLRRGASRCCARGRQGRRVRPRAGRKIRQVAADHVQSGCVIVGDIVDDPAGQRDVRTTQVLLRNIFARGLFHHRGACGEYRALAGHDGEVAHRGDQRAMTGRRSQHRGDRGHPA